MKKFTIITILAGLIQSVAAVEYVTLSNSNRSVHIAQGSLVEIVGCARWDYPDSHHIIEFTLANGDTVNSSLDAGTVYNAGPLHHPILNQKFFNLSQVKILYGYGSDPAATVTMAVSLKITPAAEIDSAGPKTVLVIPEGSTGDYDVVIESSGDMVTWTPMHSQGVSGSGPQQFFRTRIIKK